MRSCENHLSIFQLHMSLPLFGQLDLRPSARHQMLPQVQARYEDGEIQLHHAAASDFQLCACTLHSF